MKRYFIKYFPISEVLLRGDYLQDETGDIETVNGDEKSLTAAKYAIARKIKMHVHPFICSEEIHIGDVNCFKSNGLYLGDCVGKDIYRINGKHENAIKIIGQVSEENKNVLPGLIVAEKNLLWSGEEKAHFGYSMLKVFKINV